MSGSSTSQLYQVKLHGGVKTGLKQRDLVNEVVLDYFNQNPQSTLTDMQQAFPKNVQKKLEIVVDEHEATELNSKRKQYNIFMKTFEDSGAYIAICNQWGAGNTDGFIAHAKQMGYEIALDGGAFEEKATPAAQPPAEIKKPQYKAGQRIQFGSYKWIVLHVAEKHLFVISEIAVALMPMGDVDWQYSNVRRWLNEDFYNSFSPADQQRIAMQKATYAPQNEGIKTVNGYFGLLTATDFIGFLHIHSNITKEDIDDTYESDGDLYHHSSPWIKGISVPVAGKPNQHTHWWLLSAESIAANSFAIADDTRGNHIGYPELDFEMHNNNQQSLRNSLHITSHSGVRPTLCLKV
ncbi:MAG: DUF6273 domain-containing protein [Defluviitaleaceae bacterium]|nr:DUF6273 domain-containing protein [Defluviitaleaceae bacterium]